MNYVIGLNERSQHPRSFKGGGYISSFITGMMHLKEGVRTLKEQGAERILSLD